MPRLDLVILRLKKLADVHALRATRVEFATLGRVCRRRNIPLEDNSLHLVIRVRNGNGGEQRLCVRVKRIIENFVRFAEFHHVSEIHYEYLVGYVFNDRKIVRNEHVSKVQFLL